MSASNREHRSLIDLTLRNQQFMRVAPLCIGAIVNAVLAIFNGVVGFSQSLLWEQSMAVYFAILCFMGSYVAACSIKPERHSERNVMMVCGISIIVLAVSIAFVKYLIIGESHKEAYHPYVMIFLAAFTFATAAIAIADAFKARNGNGYQQAFLRVSIASMLGAMMILEMQMLSTFAGPADASAAFAIEVASGAAFVLLLLLMGVSLIAKSRRT
jgi:hypothetical protein